MSGLSPHVLPTRLVHVYRAIFWVPKFLAFNFIFSIGILISSIIKFHAPKVLYFFMNNTISVFDYSKLEDIYESSQVFTFDHHDIICICGSFYMLIIKAY